MTYQEIGFEPTVNAGPVEKPMVAYVKEKATKKNAIIRSSYATKKAFINDLHGNGYSVRYVCLDTPEEIEKASQKYHDNLDLQRNIQRAKREHTSKSVETTNETKNEKSNNTSCTEVTNKISYKRVENDNGWYSKIFHCGEIYELKDLKNNTVVYGECVRVNYKTVDFIIDGVKHRLKVLKSTVQYSASSKKYEVFSTHIVEPVEPDKDTNDSKLSDYAITHINNAYNWIVGELINGLCDNKPDTPEYKDCFYMLHSGEKLVNYIYNECLENGFDVGWCGLGQAPEEIKKYDGWLIKQHIRHMLDLDNIFSFPADNDTVIEGGGDL